MDENAGPVGPSQIPAPPGYPPPPAAPPQGWAPGQAPPPPPPPPGWTGHWQAAPAAPLTRAQRGRAWNSVSLGLGGGAVYFGFGGLLAAGLAWIMWKAPIGTNEIGVQGTVDRTVGHFILDLFAVGFAMMAIAGGLVGGIAGVGGLITRKVTLAALSIAGVAVAGASLFLGWYILAGISSWHW